MMTQQFCEKYGITEDQFYGKTPIHRYLRLLRSKKLPDGFNPIVYGSLDLDCVTELPIGFNPIVGQNLYLNNIKEIPIGFNPKVGCSLDLSHIKEIPEWFNPIVGKDLYLSSVSILPGWFNPIVGGAIFYSNGARNIEGYFNNLNNLTFSWENGKYIKVDGIFSEVISRKGNIFKIKYIGDTEEYWLIGNEEGTIWSHGNTLAKANDDLQFKIMRMKIKSSPIFPDTIIDKNYYRIITRSCEAGCDRFIKENNLKESYTAKELLNILEEKKAYGLETFKSLIKF